MVRFQADCDKDGYWFVFDYEVCYCAAGPLKEYDAVELAIKLNKEIKERANEQT